LEYIGHILDNNSNIYEMVLHDLTSPKISVIRG
jgi:hypothetical protein